MPRTRKPSGNVSPTESAAGTLLQGLQLITALLVAKGVPVDKIGQGLCRLATDEGLASREKIAEIIFRLTHVINLDQACGYNSRTVEQKEQGLLVWDEDQISTLNLSREQSGYEVVHSLAEKGKVGWNFGLAKYLMSHEELIPKAWDGKKIHFFGSIFGWEPGYGNGEKDVMTLSQKTGKPLWRQMRESNRKLGSEARWPWFETLPPLNPSGWKNSRRWTTELTPLHRIFNGNDDLVIIQR